MIINILSTTSAMKSIRFKLRILYYIFYNIVIIFVEKKTYLEILTIVKVL